MESDVHTRVREIVDSADRIGLLESGCPDGEYEPEIRDFVKRLEAGHRPTEDMVGSVLRSWFGDELVTQESIAQIARELTALFDSSLVGHTFRLTAIIEDGHEVPIVEGTDPTLSFAASSFQGQTGCNRLWADYEVDGEGLLVAARFVRR